MSMTGSKGGMRPVRAPDPGQPGQGLPLPLIVAVAGVVIGGLAFMAGAKTGGRLGAVENQLRAMMAAQEKGSGTVTVDQVNDYAKQIESRVLEVRSVLDDTAKSVARLKEFQKQVETQLAMQKEGTETVRSAVLAQVEDKLQASAVAVEGAKRDVNAALREVKILADDLANTKRDLRTATQRLDAMEWQSGGRRSTAPGPTPGPAPLPGPGPAPR